MQVADQIVDTVATFGKQRSVQSSFLGTSTSLFYPDGVPENVSVLPRLSDEGVSRVQGELDVQARLLLDAVQKERRFLARLIGKDILQASGQVFVVEQRDLPTIALSESGAITVDLRVLQSIYRGVLLSVTADLLSNCRPAKSNRCQRQALQLVFAAREQFLQFSPIPAVTQAKDAIQIAGTQPRSMEELGVAMSELLDSRLADAGAQALSIEASKRFDDAVMFVVAHELAHRVLEHYRRSAAGERRFDLELEADRFAGVLMSLVRNASVRPRNPVLKQIDGEIYELTSAGWCPGTYNHVPTGHKDFFEYGYEFAGFSDGSSDYPSQDTRARRVRPVVAAAMDAIDLAQRQKGRCGGGMPKESPEVFLEENYAYRIKELKEWKDVAAEKTSTRDVEWYRQVITKFEDLIQERRLGDQFYLEFIRRL